MPNLNTLAADVDAALDSLETVIDAYLTETRARDKEYRTERARKRTGTMAEPHPVHSYGQHYVKSAVASRQSLARILDLNLVRPAVTLAEIHPAKFEG